MERQLLLKVDEAADRIGVSRSMVYKLIATGELPRVKVGRSLRIPVGELDRWLNQKLASAGIVLANPANN